MDPPGPFFSPLKMDPQSIFTRWKWTPGPFFAVENGPPVHFHPLKMDPPVNFLPLKMDPPRKVRNIANVTHGPFSLCKMDPPVHFSPLKMDPRSIFTRWKWTTGSLFAVVNGPLGSLFAVVNGPPWSTFSRGKWTPLGKLRILQTLPPVPFHYAKCSPPPSPLKVTNIAKLSPVSFPLCKMDPRPLFTMQNGPPGQT